MLDKHGNDSSDYNRNNIDLIKKSSPKVAGFIEDEYNRQRNNVELIASENYCSEAVMAACGSCLSWKYAEGYPGKPIERHSGNSGRYYGRMRHVDELEEYCCDMWRKVFNTDYHVNVQPHSGSQANFAAYRSVLKPGDTVLAMNLDDGGHLTHGSSVNFSGTLYDIHFYGVDSKGYIDIDDLKKKANELKPKLILAGASAYSRTIDFAVFSEVAKSIGAYLMVDMAHIAGLVAAGEHISPFGYADLVTTTTHKTLRGPRGGMIFSVPELAKKVDSAVFPYSQGGPLEHIIAGKAVCAEEALREDYKEYIHQVVLNSKAFCNEFIKMGYSVVTGGTDNHLFLLDLSNHEFTGKDLQDSCDEEGITLNKNCVPNEKRSPVQTSGVRIGTAPMTTRGFKEDDFIEVAHRIDKIVKKLDKEKTSQK